MNDMKSVIVPDSSQINADELQAGPITVKIAAVKIKGGKEQPVDIVLDGMEKVYRPCKSMCRIIVAAWGPDSSKYVGRSMTLYCDPSIKWGGLAVGGLRISHMSDIDSAITMALTVTRANKRPFTVKPLAQNPAAHAAQAPVMPLSEGHAPVAAGPAIDTTAILRAFGTLGYDLPQVEELAGLPLAAWTAETVNELRDIYKARNVKS